MKILQIHNEQLTVRDRQIEQLQRDIELKDGQLQQLQEDMKVKDEQLHSVSDTLFLSIGVLVPLACRDGNSTEGGGDK